MSNLIKKIWKEHDQKILFFLAFILIAAVSFNAGRTYENTKESAQINVKINPLEADNPKEEKILALGEALERKGIDPTAAGSNNKESGKSVGAENPQECMFVGSKNSDKYHLPDCRYAKNIKRENLVCFSSTEEAEKQGYVAAGCCIK